MSLPTGVWKVNVNGTEGDLTIQTPNQQGVFAGVVLGKNVKGFWDEASQTITFNILVGALIDFPAVVTFKGYLFRSSNPVPGGDVLTTLTGFVQANDGNGGFPFVTGNSRHNVFGWFAQITEIL